MQQPNSVVKTLKQINLFNYFNEELTLWRIIPSKTAKRFSIICFVSFIIPIFLIYYGIYNNENILIACLILISLLIPITFLVTSIRLSRKYVLNHYNEYSALINDSYVLYQHQFLNAYRLDRIETYIISNKYTPDDKEECIAYFENQNKQIIKSRWLPISLIAIMLFPIWSELIGFIIGKSDTISSAFAISIVLVLSSLPFCYIVFALNYFFRATFLSKADKYNELANILKQIRLDEE